MAERMTKVIRFASFAKSKAPAAVKDSGVKVINSLESKVSNHFPSGMEKIQASKVKIINFASGIDNHFSTKNFAKAKRMSSGFSMIEKIKAAPTKIIDAFSKNKGNIFASLKKRGSHGS